MNIYELRWDHRDHKHGHGSVLELGLTIKNEIRG